MKKLLFFILLLVGGGFYLISQNPADGSGTTSGLFSAIVTPIPARTVVPSDMTATAAAAAIASEIREATIAAARLSAENANATAASIQATADYNALRATQIVEQSTAAQAEYYRRETADVDDANRRATESAGQAARDSQATADARAGLSQSWTVTADAAILSGAIEQTKLAGYGTATAVSNDAIGTQAAATSIAFAVEKANERAELTNQAVAVLPFAVYIAVSIFSIAVSIAFLPVLRRRISVIFRDKRGDSPLIFDDSGTIADPDRNPFPFMKLGRAAAVPESIPADLADRVSARDQIVDFSSRGLPGAANGNGAKSTAKLPPAMTPNPQARAIFHVFGVNDRPNIPPETVEILDAEWRESRNG